MVVKQKNIALLPRDQNPKLVDKLERLLQVFSRDLITVPILSTR
jgi:hypothetical protein